MRASPITPTDWTGSSTAKAWAVWRSRPGGLELVEEDRVGLAEDLEPRRGHLAQAADGQAGAGERVPPDERVGQAELQAEPADLVLEQVAERLDQLEAELLGQAADVVVDA